jgi:hypothetical protein
MPGQSRVAGPFKKLLVATDFSPHAQAALQTAVWLAQRSNSEIVLTHVVAEIPTVVAALAYDAFLAEDIERTERELRRDSDERLAAFEREFGAAGVRLKRETLGHPVVAQRTATGVTTSCCGGQPFHVSRIPRGKHGEVFDTRVIPSDVWITHSIDFRPHRPRSSRQSVTELVARRY